jgi:hypothetical protein
LAFHPYPQLIRAVFNPHRFGPPCGVTHTSPWPWVDHPVSRLPPHTVAPSSDSLSLRMQVFDTLILAWDEQLVGSLSKRHAVTRSEEQAPTVCKHTVSGSISLPSEGFFSPFPHGTGALSVTREYLALEGGPPSFTQGFTCPALLRNTATVRTISPTGLSPSLAGLSRPFCYRASGRVRVLQPRFHVGTGLGSSPFARHY